MKYKALCYCLVSAAVLLSSFFFSWGAPFWKTIDTAIFTSLNQTLEGRPHLQLFWAITNHHLFDWVEDLVFISFFALSIYQTKKEERLKRMAQFLFTILLSSVIIFFVNRVIFQKLVDFPRASPSLCLPCIRLSDEIPWMKIKDYANTCFPADHATTLVLFATLYTYYAGKKLGKYAIFYALFRAIPRLIAGAHWFSDVAVGSSSIALFFLSLALCTPIATWGVLGVHKTLLWGKKLRLPLKKERSPHAL